MYVKLLCAAAALSLVSAGQTFANDDGSRKPVEVRGATAQERMAAKKAAARRAAAVRSQARTPVSSDVAVRLGIPVDIIASRPVPDTPANRARYGGPMSNAGRMTRPAGN
jgi:hypothetical protein